MCVSEEAMPRRRAVPQYRCAYTRRLAFHANSRARLSEFLSVGRTDATYTLFVSSLAANQVAEVPKYCCTLVTRSVHLIFAGDAENVSD
jgi:hypothetical protein